MATPVARSPSHSISDDPTLKDAQSTPDEVQELPQEEQQVQTDEDRPAGIPTEKDSPGSGRDPNVVDWDHDDKANPKNWSITYKIFITMQLGLLAFGASLGSSILSPTNEVLAGYLDVSVEVTVLNVSLYV